MKYKSLDNQHTELIHLLKSERNEGGFWSGRLSSSALATAVSIVALRINGDCADQLSVNRGLGWLLNHKNSDGGFGDTSTSLSNVSTSLLCYAAISYCGNQLKDANSVLSGLETYLSHQNIDLKGSDITTSVLSYYGMDFTFSVPILSMLVICGVLKDNAIKKIPQLPFEFTLFPASWYSAFNLRVVSYAIPALIAVGIFTFKTRKRHSPLMKWIRNRSIKPTLTKLEQIVPQSGGFLEAIPLTAFVGMCLISSGYGDCQVVNKGLTFLRNQQRPDSSWPIDTDLSTWVTTLSIKAVGPKMTTEFSEGEINRLTTHLKSIQYRDVHPFNLAQPGGWGWTNFSGSVPDVDDTAGAILALLVLYKSDEDVAGAIINGSKWLTTLQNKDGGFPTFCKGWGKLPFDCSCADLTGHAMFALTKSLNMLGNKMSSEFIKLMNNCISRAFGYLWKVQQDDGHWVPLWFGNQFTKNQQNPVYGTAKVSIYLQDTILCNILNDNMKRNIDSMVSKAKDYLLNQQNEDGSWGGEKGIRGTIEESALAIAALSETHREACLKGFEWLGNEYIENGFRSNPIGLYFAMLWYDEKLFPLIYYIEALGRFLK